MKYKIVHSTHYHYSQSVSLCHSLAHLQPRELNGQFCQSSVLEIFPKPVDYQERYDYFGNRVVYFAIQQPHTELIVTAHNDVEVRPTECQSDLASMDSWETVLQQIQAPALSSEDSVIANIDACLFSLDSELSASSADLERYATPSFKPGRSLLEVATDLTQRIYHDFSFDPSFTTISTPLAQVLNHKRGVCQDFAHLAIACFRCFGLPARYVSGYIETAPPPGQKKLSGSDESHAWFSVYQPGIGWFDFDPTNNCRPDEQHVTIAWGRDYSDVTPLKGLAIGGNKHDVSVSVDVVRTENAG